MKLSIILLSALLASCTSGVKHIDHKDSTECAVFEGWPLVKDADVEPVYIPVSVLGIYKAGDTVALDLTTNLPDGIPLHRSDEKQGRWIDPSRERVVIKNREKNNKYILIHD